MRRILVTHGTMSFGGSPMKVTGKEWVERECGTTIFGNDSQKRNVCDSCLRGYTHENNYMLDTEENKKLLQSEQEAQVSDTTKMSKE